MSQIWMSHVTNIGMSHVTNMNELCRAYMDESCHKYEWVMSQIYWWVVSQIWMSHVTHIGRSHVTNMNESCHAHDISPRDWVATHDWFIRDVTSSFVTWLFHSCVATQSLRRYITCVTWRIHMCHMTHSYMQHSSFMCHTTRSPCRMRDTTHSHTRMHMHLMTYTYEWRDSFVRVTRLCRLAVLVTRRIHMRTFICATWLIRICDMTHSYLWHKSMP